MQSLISDSAKKLGRGGVAVRSLSGTTCKGVIVNRTNAMRRREDRASVRAALDDLHAEVEYLKIENDILMDERYYEDFITQEWDIWDDYLYLEYENDLRMN